MSANIEQIYIANPSTTAPDDALFYMGLSPYTAGDSSAIKKQDLFNQLIVNNSPRISVLAASTVGIAGTYNNGSSGVGATFTVTATGFLILDGFGPFSAGDRVLLKNQGGGTGNPLQNGIYVVTNPGGPGVQAVLTRATDYNTTALVAEGSYVLVITGNTQQNTMWIMNQISPTIGTQPISFAEIVAPDVTKLPLAGGTLTGNLILSNFSTLMFDNNTSNDSMQWRFYDNGGGELNLSLDAFIGGVLKQLFIVNRTDAASGSAQFTYSFPLASRNIGLTNQGVWFGGQPILPVAINASSGTANTNATDSNIFTFTLSTNTTLANPSSAIAGMTIQWWITQDAVTARTVTLGSDFVPTALTPTFVMPTTLSSVVCLSATCINSKWRYTFT